MLPSILRHENVARIEDDVLLIGDRRKFPFRREFYKAYDASDAACAIRMMVTQGGGPLETALQAMVLTARKFGKNMDELRKSGDMLASARKTNTTMKRELASLLDEFETMGSRAFADAAQELVNSRLEEYDEKYLAMAECGCRLIKDGDGILTTCFPEHSFFLSLSLAREEGKRFTVYAQETRPYLQGAHLTAPSLAELAFDHYLITDNMAAFLISSGKVNIYMTASDLATRRKWVINKLGTLSSAISCHAYGVPYYAFSMGFDDSYVTLSGKEVEFRDPQEVKECQGIPVTGADVRALYPCFDVIPPEYVSAIVTPDEILR